MSFYPEWWHKRNARARRNDSGGIKIKAYIGAATRKKWPRRIYDPLIIDWLMTNYRHVVEVITKNSWRGTDPKKKTYTWQRNGDRFYI